MNHSKYCQKAIPLVGVDDKSGRYTLTKQASEFIQSIPSPIGVVSVAGLYRTGKSYLLNRMLLNRSSGFGVGPTVNPCTKGLWCWGSPIKGTSSEGESVNIIVIDTQGIGALDEDQTHDTRIFTLAILASSCFIYNSVGSIDQNAIQNLSLVANLTKHIQIRTNSYLEDEDPNKIASYFPTFYWVVRDFSLQLVDSDGNQLTSKQYLEKALAPQKGYSDDTQEKNNIRKLLTTCFKERQCFTLIRPLVDESKLQHLDRLDFDQLRPDFVDQILNFRKRVINRIKVKTINDKKLNGEMYLSMLNSYVLAINDGAVPNIQNAWNYMCRQQCSKVLSQSYEAFERQLNNYKSSCSEEEFQINCDSALEVGYETFKAKSFGEISEQFWKELNKKMKIRIKALKSEIQKQARNQIQLYFSKNFDIVKKKLRCGEFKQYGDFKNQMEAQYDAFLELGPKIMGGKVLYLELYKKILPQGAEFFFKTFKVQAENLQKINLQKQKAYEAQINMLKSNIEKDSQINSQKVSSLDREKIQMQLAIQNYKDKIDKMTKEYSSEQQRLTKTITTKQLELQKFKKQLESNIHELSMKYQDIQKKLLTEEKQWEKQKALFELKIKQQLTTIDELQKKQKTLDSTLNISKNQLSLQLKQTINKHQRKTGQLTLQINQLKENNHQLKDELKVVKEELDEKCQKFDKKEKKYKEDLASRTKELEKLKHQYELQKNRIENDNQVHKEGLQRENRQIVQTHKKQQLTIKNLNQSFKNQKISYEKQIAVLLQKIQFLGEDLKDSKQQMIEAKQSYQATILTLETSNGQANQQLQNQRILDLKNTHTRAIKNLQNQYQNNKKKMEFQIDNLTKTKNDLELKITLLTQSLNNTKIQTDQKIMKMQQQIQIQTNELKNMQRSKNTLLMQKEAYYENKIKQIESQMEEIKDIAISEQKDSHSKSEQSITHLKNYYQFEKQKLQSKLISQKQRNEKKCASIIEEYQKRLKQQIDALQQQVEQLQDQRLNMETTFQNTISQLQHESDLKSKDLQNLTRIIQQLKENFNKRQLQYNQKLDSLVQTYKAQKQVHYQKAQFLQSQNNKKDKQILSLTHIRDQLTANLQNRESKLNQLEIQILQSKENYEKIIQQWKKKIQHLSHENLNQKINNQKAIALANQQNEFNGKKVQELQKQINSISNNYQQKIKSIKEDLLNEAKANLQKIGNQKLLIQQKYQKIKKGSRQVQGVLQKQVTELTKEKAVDNEKMINMEQRYKDSQSKRITQTSFYQQQIVKLKQASSNERKSLSDQLSEIKKLLEATQNEKNQIMNNYEKDKLLMQNKIKFLQEAKESLKKENSDNIKKLQNTLQNLQKNRMNQKTSAQTNYIEQISQVQNNYRTKIADLTENLSKKTHELQGFIKRYDLQIKVLNQKLALQTQSKNNIQQQTEKKITQLIETQKKLITEIERLKQQRDQKGIEYHKTIQTEKQFLKNKVRQSDQRYKQMEKQKQHLYFESEKQKAKWKIQKQNIDQKMEQLKDKISKYERQVSKLQRDNQKLKAEKKNKAHSFISNNKWNTTFIEEKKTNINKEQQYNKENILN